MIVVGVALDTVHADRGAPHHAQLRRPDRPARSHSRVRGQEGRLMRLDSSSGRRARARARRPSGPDRAVRRSRRSRPATCCARRKTTGTPLGKELDRLHERRAASSPTRSCIDLIERAHRRRPTPRTASSSTAFRARSPQAEALDALLETLRYAARRRRPARRPARPC